jgi:tetratricopeptide (TPR) repeat protein
MRHPIVLVAFSAFLTGAVSLRAADDAANTWASHYVRYAGQKSIAVEYGFSARQAPGYFSLRQLLQELPEPAKWSEVQRALNDAAAKIPADRPLDRKRLRAGEWMLRYLLADRVALKTEIDGLLAAEKDPDAAGIYALMHLADALGKPADRHLAAGLKEFEEALIQLEPVSDADAEKAVGGAENFLKLKRLIDASLALHQRFRKIAEEYQKDKDEAAAGEKSEAAQKKFLADTEADRKTLEPFRENAVVARYADLHIRPRDESSRSARALDAPDLVALVGRERAAEWLERALRLPVKLRVEKGEETLRLARETALRRIAELKVPQWSLATDQNSVALFEALHGRFPTVAADDHEYEQAVGWYMGGLIMASRVEDAVEFATNFTGKKPVQLPSELLDNIERRGMQQELWGFLKAWLPKNPGANEWDRFNRLSVQLGHQTELAELLGTMAASDAFQGLDWIRIQRLQANADLATDRLLPAREKLRGILQRDATTEEEFKAQLEVAERLLALADLQNDASFSAMVLGQTETALEKLWGKDRSEALSRVATLIGQLNGLGRHADAARIGAAAMKKITLAENSPKNPDPQAEPMDLPWYHVQELLIERLAAEVELHHWGEAEAILQASPQWGADDLAGLLASKTSAMRRPVGYYVARVALAQKDPVTARRVLEAQLTATPGDDALYQEYLEHVGTEALPLLEKLFATDRYEERPLIWKSKLQLKAGKVDEAVATLQQAIEIDPSDGEEGRGDRMRVYAFMSEAMTAKGDSAKAKFFSDVVKSIRVSELADRWFHIGAYQRAIKLYREALNSFQDAYCIQSRLAIRLAGEGKMAEALVHYRRAYELMPTSFGRVESHCFGCEHVFAGEEQQRIAEEVFTKLLREQPSRPQVHYLIGYLREAQERPQEAAEYYRKAVQLDPLYLNAWDKLSDLDRKLSFTASQRDDLELRLLELDPRARHASADLGRVSDLPRLWNALRVAQAAVRALPSLEKLYPLNASAERIAAKPESAMSSGNWYHPDFGTALLDHDFIQAIQNYLSELNEEPEANPR